MVRITMNTLKRLIIISAVLGLAGPVTALEGSQAELEKQMEEAHQQLEQAAEKIAELSRKMAGGEVRGILQHVEQPRKAMLGINIGRSDAQNPGVLIEHVVEGGPAASAGLQEGDVITRFNNINLAAGDSEEAAEMLLEELRRLEPDERVSVQVVRDKQVVNTDVTLDRSENVMSKRKVFHNGHHGIDIQALENLGAMFDDSDFDFSFDFDEQDFEHFKNLPELLEKGLAGISDMPIIAIMGGPGALLPSLKLTAVDEQLGTYFGVEKGALVTATPKDDTLGLKAGDVIVAINDEDIENHHDAHRVIRKAKSGQSLAFGIMRQRQALTVDVVVPQFDLGDDWSCQENKSGKGRKCVKKDGHAFSFNFSDDEED